MGFPSRIIPRNVFDLATLTSTIAPYVTTPLVNLQNSRRARICRWPAASGTQSIKGTWNGQGFLVGGGGLDRFNLEPSALVRIRGWANADWTGTLLIDTGSVAPYNAAALGSFTWGRDPLGTSIYDGYLGYKYFATWFAKQTIASFQIDITDTGNSWQVIDLSRVVLGDYLETTYVPAPGMRPTWKDTSEQVETDGGSLLSNARLPRRSIVGTFQFLTPTDRKAIYDFIRFVGKTKTFAATFQAGEGASLERDLTILQAKLIDIPELSWDQPSGHTVPFSIVEA